METPDKEEVEAEREEFCLEFLRSTVDGLIVSEDEEDDADRIKSP